MAKIGALPQHTASLFKPGGGEQVETLLLQNALLNNVAGGGQSGISPNTKIIFVGEMSFIAVLLHIQLISTI